MNNTVFEIVVNALKAAGVLADEAGVQRTVLVNNGYYVGQKFRYEGGYPVWWADSGEIKVHDENGTPLYRIGPDATGGGEGGVETRQQMGHASALTLRGRLTAYEGSSIRIRRNCLRLPHPRPAYSTTPTA